MTEPHAHAPLPHINSLDGVRGMAVALIMIYHLRVSVPWPAAARLAGCGWIGVDIFFTLSGFLITRMLIHSRNDASYFLPFYTKRAYRIWPLYYALLFASFFLALLAHKASTEPWLAYLTLTQNLVLASFGMEMLRMTWSLVIEEQFYLIWPFLLRFLRLSWLFAGGLCLMAIAPFVRLFFLRSHPGVFVYMRTFTHYDGILLGSLLAIWFASRNFSPGAARLWLWAGLLAGGIGVFLLISPEGDASGQHAVLLYSSLAVFATGLVGLCALSVRPFTSVFDLPALRYLGKISYGIYLLHIQTFDVLNSMNTRMHLNAVPFLLVKPLVAVGIAAVSWHFFELEFIEKGREMAKRGE